MKLFFFGLVFTLFSLGAFAQETNTECAAMNNSREKIVKTISKVKSIKNSVTKE